MYCATYKVLPFAHYVKGNTTFEKVGQMKLINKKYVFTYIIIQT